VLSAQILGFSYGNNFASGGLGNSQVVPIGTLKYDLPLLHTNDMD